MGIEREIRSPMVQCIRGRLACSHGACGLAKCLQYQLGKGEHHWLSFFIEHCIVIVKRRWSIETMGM
jgi:hypothetical protein